MYFQSKIVKYKFQIEVTRPRVSHQFRFTDQRQDRFLLKTRPTNLDSHSRYPK